MLPFDRSRFHFVVDLFHLGGTDVALLRLVVEQRFVVRDTLAHDRVHDHTG